MTARYAIYFAPADDSALAEFGRVALNRSADSPETDAFATEADPVLRSHQQRYWHGFDDSEQLELIRKPRHYGFHATLRAPFELSEGETPASLTAALQSFCLQQDAVTLDGLAPRPYKEFLALTLADRRSGVDQLAATIVDFFEPYRAPLSNFDIERRKPERLSESERQCLYNHGYPYVRDNFNFHMTLTGRLTPQQARELTGPAQVFESLVTTTPVLDRLALFMQPDRSTPFFRVIDHKLRS